MTDEEIIKIRKEKITNGERPTHVWAREEILKIVKENNLTIEDFLDIIYDSQTCHCAHNLFNSRKAWCGDDEETSFGKDMTSAILDIPKDKLTCGDYCDNGLCATVNVFWFKLVGTILEKYGKKDE